MPLKIDKNRFFTISPRKSKSQRFSQLRFEGFRPQGRNILEKFTTAIADFFKFLGKYVARKFKHALISVKKLFSFSINTVQSSKSLMVRKLIWSRGRLGRPIATSIVMVVALVVFMFGKVFSTSRYVVSKEIEPGYLENVTDIIPQKNIALTTVPESRKRAEAFAYTIQPGDTLSSIGNEFKISIDALQYVNGLTDSSLLKVGSDLTIPPVSGLIHAVEKDDTLSSIAKKYDVAPQAIADFNYILDTSTLAVGTELVIPGASVPAPVIVALPAPGPNATVTRPGTVDPGASQGWCIWPTTSRIITQYLAWYHNGMDISTPRGQGMPPIYSCAGGVVIRAGWDPWGLGLHIIVDHGNGYETIYGHLGQITVGYGQQVSQGEVIGIMGSTGRSTGPHVHFTVKYQGVPQNPLNYVQ